MTITSECTFDCFRIKFNGIIQMSVKNKEIFTVQTWRIGTTYFAIEFVSLSGATSLYEYDTEEKWKAIIKELEDNKII